MEIDFNIDKINELIAIFNSISNEKVGDGNWLAYYKRAMDGFKAIIYGLKGHYNCLQSMSNIIHDILKEGSLTEDELIKLDHHVSDILFNLDSAIECMVFALNAIGYGIMDTNGFLSIEDDKKLREIGPHNVFNITNKFSYQKYFPALVKYWLEVSEIRGYVTPKKLWKSIRDQHDVSKHRSRIYHSHMGSKNEIDIILDVNPKEPLNRQTPVDFNAHYPWTLNEHINAFVIFINKSCDAMYLDLTNFLNTL